MILLHRKNQKFTDLNCIMGNVYEIKKKYIKSLFVHATETVTVSD